MAAHSSSSLGPSGNGFGLIGFNLGSAGRASLSAAELATPEAGGAGSDSDGSTNFAETPPREELGGGDSALISCPALVEGRDLQLAMNNVEAARIVIPSIPRTVAGARRSLTGSARSMTRAYQLYALLNFQEARTVDARGHSSHTFGRPSLVEPAVAG